MEDRQLGRAWLAPTFAILLHATDEAPTGFLSVYNPTGVAMRARIPWLPVATFGFGIWLGGLVAGIMILNALGHTAGTIAGRTFASIRFPRPMPGFYWSRLVR
jgi:hypothetical protein